MSDSVATVVEPLYVLYGSQMGNSEQYAKLFCSKLKKKYTPAFFQEQGLPTNIQVETSCIQLDDFLEMKHAAFTKCVVIFVSSYGVGQAPLGAYRFRELCDTFSDDKDSTYGSALQGLKYAICGLGDSTYTTYMKNPTSIDAGLTAAGGQRIGAMAQADADGMRETGQDATIRRWVEDLWVPLAKAMCSASDDETNVRVVDTKAMQANTIPLLMKLDPDYTPPKELLKGKGGNNSGPCSTTMGLAGLSLAVIAIAVVAATKL
jgi:sulfite reductase alpha subunit-like flavoprotein